ncbi:MAG: hypothetical protein RLZZ387_1401 [Chloroflexota bacterium]|jgi:hypothetical protein
MVSDRGSARHPVNDDGAVAPREHYGYDRIRQMTGAAAVPEPGPDTEEILLIIDGQPSHDHESAEEERRRGDA